MASREVFINYINTELNWYLSDFLGTQTVLEMCFGMTIRKTIASLFFLRTGHRQDGPHSHSPELSSSYSSTAGSPQIWLPKRQRAWTVKV